MSKEINKQVAVLNPEVLRKQAHESELNGWDGVEIRFSNANLRALADLIEQAEETN